MLKMMDFVVDRPRPDGLQACRCLRRGLAARFYQFRVRHLLHRYAWYLPPHRHAALRQHALRESEIHFLNYEIHHLGLLHEHNLVDFEAGRDAFQLPTDGAGTANCNITAIFSNVSIENAE